MPEVLVVFSSDTACVARVRRLLPERTRKTVLHARNAEQLRQLAEELTQQPSRGGTADMIEGVVVDLIGRHVLPARWVRDAKSTASQKRDLPLTPNIEIESQVAWIIVSLLAAMQFCPPIPLILVDRDTRLSEALRRVGVQIVAQVAPDGDDASWLDVLRQLPFGGYDVLESGDLQRCTGRLASSDPVGTGLPEAAVQLDSDLWYDQPSCSLYRGFSAIPLTARENALLALLLQRSRSYQNADTLARLLTRADAYPVAEHSVEQTMMQFDQKMRTRGVPLDRAGRRMRRPYHRWAYPGYLLKPHNGLRRKLGERAKDSRLLLSRRGVGYGLFPRAGAARIEAPTMSIDSVS